MINSIAQQSTVQNNVIPQPSSGRKPGQTAFQSAHGSSDTFEAGNRPEQKESFLHKHRGIIGFIIGAMAGEFVSQRFILSKMQNVSFWKEFAIKLPIDTALGLAGQIAAMQIGNQKQ